MGRQSSAHLPLCMAHFKGLKLTFNGIKDSGVQRAILDNLHTIMYMLEILFVSNSQC